MSNAPEINSFVSVVNELAKTDKDTVSARIAKRLNKSVPWPPTQIESHLQIKSYQKWLESYFPGRINRGGLGHLWSQAYKHCEKPQQIDIEEQITAQAAEMIAPKNNYSKTPDLSFARYTRAEKNLIKQMFEDGASDVEISQSLGRSAMAIGSQRHILKLHRRRVKHWSESDNSVLMDMFNNGHTYKEIAKKLDRTEGSIEKRLRKLGMKRSRPYYPVDEPTPEPTPALIPTQPTPVKPVAPKPMTKPLSWWRRLFG